VVNRFLSLTTKPS